MSNQQTGAKPAQDTAEQVRKLAEQQKVAAAGEDISQAKSIRYIVAGIIMGGVAYRANTTDALRQVPLVVRLTDALLLELAK